MKGSLVIIVFFVLGAFLGFNGLAPSLFIDYNISLYALCTLVFFVGISITSDPKILRSFRSLNPRLLLLPLMTIIGTLIGTAVVGFIYSEHPVTDCMAVGSGFGYYSLSSVLIGEKRSADLATIALLSNIIREIIALVGAPIINKYLGPYATIAAGGATTLDTTLPTITNVIGKDYTILCIFHGLVLDASVVILVTFLCSL